jgi:hypothetical protein
MSPKELLKVRGVVVDVKKYYKGNVDFIAGEGIILNEFIGRWPHGNKYYRWRLLCIFLFAR